MTNEKAIMCLEDMKIKVPIPKAAKQARENNEALDVAIKALKPEPHEIGYDDCSNALLKMWMDNVLTDGEYYRIADKLNEKWGKTVLPEPYKGVTT